MEDIYKTYPHNPPHYFVPNAMYIVTGAILHNRRLLKDDKHKLLVMDILLERATHWKWDLEAWAILENHYHFIARAPENALTLEKLIRQFHSKSAVELNKLDKTLGARFGTTIGILVSHSKHLIMRVYIMFISIL